MIRLFEMSKSIWSQRGFLTTISSVPIFKIAYFDKVEVEE